MGRLIGKIQLSFFAVTFLSISALAGGSIAGKVTIVKGQVFIVRGSEKIQVKKDITVLESDVIESQAGGTARITMIDSNLVDVYPKSKVEIAKYVYKPNEDQKEVELKVDFGKIKSTVNQKYDGAKNKYQVKTPSAVAGVRGTVFTTEYDAAKKVSRVTTIEGLVAVTKMLERGERQAPPVFVRPNQEVKLDIQSAKAEQPRDLKTEERDERKKEDKDLGYQYDPKSEPTPAADGAASKFERPAPIKDIPVKEIADKAPVKEIKEIQPPKGIDNIKPPKVITDNVPVREAPPVREVVIKEPLKNIRDVSERREQREQEKQERRQAASEEQQGKKQKQLEEEQAKKQKQLEEEQARKQKQAEEEQAKKQKQLEEEQAKKQKAIEELLAAKRKQAEEAQAKREEEQKKRAQEIAQRRAELARRLAEIAKRAEDKSNRLPSGSSGSTPTTTLPGSILPGKN